MCLLLRVPTFCPHNVLLLLFLSVVAWVRGVGTKYPLFIIYSSGIGWGVCPQIPLRPDKFRRAGGRRTLWRSNGTDDWFSEIIFNWWQSHRPAAPRDSMAEARQVRERPLGQDGYGWPMAAVSLLEHIPFLCCVDAKDDQRTKMSERRTEQKEN